MPDSQDRRSRFDHLIGLADACENEAYQDKCRQSKRIRLLKLADIYRDMARAIRPRPRRESNYGRLEAED